MKKQHFESVYAAFENTLKNSTLVKNDVYCSSYASIEINTIAAVRDPIKRWCIKGWYISSNIEVPHLIFADIETEQLAIDIANFIKRTEVLFL